MSQPLHPLAHTLDLTGPETIREAESECLMVCALRFDGYGYIDATGYDLWPDQNVAIEEGRLPERPEERMAQFFALQRALGKFGLERATPWSKYYRAYRQLFLSTYSLDIPDPYHERGYYARWATRFAPQREAYADLIRRIDAATEYSPLEGFDFEEWRPSRDAYETVWRALAPG
jgi:hypothetical protein